MKADRIQLLFATSIVFGIQGADQALFSAVPNASNNSTPNIESVRVPSAHERTLGRVTSTSPFTPSSPAFFKGNTGAWNDRWQSSSSLSSSGHLDSLAPDQTQTNTPFHDLLTKLGFEQDLNDDALNQRAIEQHESLKKQLVLRSTRADTIRKTLLEIVHDLSADSLQSQAENSIQDHYLVPYYNWLIEQQKQQAETVKRIEAIEKFLNRKCIEVTSFDTVPYAQLPDLLSTTDSECTQTAILRQHWNSLKK